MHFFQVHMKLAKWCHQNYPQLRLYPLAHASCKQCVTCPIFLDLFCIKEKLKAQSTIFPIHCNKK
jgi:hypothetical protein